MLERRASCREIAEGAGQVALDGEAPEVASHRFVTAPKSGARRVDADASCRQPAPRRPRGRAAATAAAATALGCESAARLHDARAAIAQTRCSSRPGAG